MAAARQKNVRRRGTSVKALYLDLGMGAAGDMLTAALWELLDDRQAFLDEADRRVVIPMQPRCESLNAAVAAAIVMWELRRQHT